MSKKIITEQELLAELRVKYTNNPPEGMNSKEVLQMSDDDLLDMDYFLNEDIFDDFEEGFYIF